MLASASDLGGQDLGNGDVALSWSYPADIVAQNIVFDVFGGADPTDLFGTAYATGVAALNVNVTGQSLSGQCYFTVVARRDPGLSLPARTLALQVNGPQAPVATTPAGPASAGSSSGLGFPFAVTPAGSVYGQDDDDLLRGQVLQLLLTVPGERVVLPDYGTRLLDLVFDPNSDVLAATTQFMIGRALQKYLGDVIQVSSVSITASEGTLNVDVAYIKKADLRAQQVRVGIPLPSGASS